MRAYSIDSCHVALHFARGAAQTSGPAPRWFLILHRLHMLWLWRLWLKFRK